MINLKTIVRRAEDMVCADLNDMTVMMSIENGNYYGLDDIATEIWSIIEEPIRVTDLIDKLVEQFETTAEECEKDVISFLTELQEQNLIKVN